MAAPKDFKSELNAKLRRIHPEFDNTPRYIKYITDIENGKFSSTLTLTLGDDENNLETCRTFVTSNPCTRVKDAQQDVARQALLWLNSEYIPNVYDVRVSDLKAQVARRLEAGRALKDPMQFARSDIHYRAVDGCNLWWVAEVFSADGTTLCRTPGLGAPSKKCAKYNMVTVAMPPN
eukprot:PhM_4_TR3423/c0_g1_i1/m.342